ncbi:MAG: LysR family transcriptional regulator [Lachnospiraceae bacterium]|nr:LysR family transcriptional regulator [Lachnospiraceae bacterium]
MYNRQLDTFLKVAEQGNFSKAAKELYITSGAVTQQINNLEASLNVELFHRTRHGLTLTEAGKYLLQEAPAFIQYSKKIRENLSLLHQGAQKTICVGTELLLKCRFFYDLWEQFGGTRKGYKVQTVNVSVFNRDYKQVDILEGVKDDDLWQKDFYFVKICEMPLACAVPRSHPLVGKKILTFDDLQTGTLVTIQQERSDVLNRLSDDVVCRGIQVVKVNQYEHSVYTGCVLNQYILLTPLCWQDIYPEMITIPCEWDYTLPYGFFVRPDPSPIVTEFLTFVETFAFQ